MNAQCEIIRDMLPLYVDGVCSDASRELTDAERARYNLTKR